MTVEGDYTPPTGGLGSGIQDNIDHEITILFKCLFSTIRKITEIMK